MHDAADIHDDWIERSKEREKRWKQRFDVFFSRNAELSSELAAAKESDANLKQKIKSVAPENKKTKSNKKIRQIRAIPLQFMLHQLPLPSHFSTCLTSFPRFRKQEIAMAELRERLARSMAAEQAALDRARAAQRASPRRQFGHSSANYVGNSEPSRKASEVTDRLYNKAPRKRTAAGGTRVESSPRGRAGRAGGMNSNDDALNDPNAKSGTTEMEKDEKEKEEAVELAKPNRQAVKKASRNAQRARGRPKSEEVLLTQQIKHAAFIIIIVK